MTAFSGTWRLAWAEVVMPVGFTARFDRLSVTIDLADFNRFRRRRVYPQGSLTSWGFGPIWVQTKSGDWR